MPKSGPIIIIEDDVDDQEILQEVFTELKVSNILRFFDSCKKALDYLLNTIEQPFLILSDINLPAMTGIQLRQEINKNEFLKRKSIPFIFLTTNPDHTVIRMAYDIMAQGYFVKPSSQSELKNMMKMIVDYWRVSRHPGLA